MTPPQPTPRRPLTAVDALLALALVASLGVVCYGLFRTEDRMDPNDAEAVAPVNPPDAPDAPATTGVLDAPPATARHPITHAAFRLYGDGALRADGVYVQPGVDLAGRLVWRAAPVGAPDVVLWEQTAKDAGPMALRQALLDVHRALKPAAWAPAWSLAWASGAEPSRNLPLPASRPEADSVVMLLAEDFLFGWSLPVPVARWWDAEPCAAGEVSGG